jgi:hypothetical protein
MPDELWKPIGNPAKDKECGPNVELVQQVECLQCATLDTCLKAVPLAFLNDTAERADLVVVLQRNSQQVSPGTRWLSRTMSLAEMPRVTGVGPQAVRERGVVRPEALIHREIKDCGVHRRVLSESKDPTEGPLRFILPVLWPDV